MTFEFRPAVRENTPIIIGIAGASGSGKTYTALELAMGMAGTDGRIAVIDSEGRRSLHYADLRDPKTGKPVFRFDHCEWRAPFSPIACLEVLKSAEAAGYRVILVDSFSDEHEGEGGLIDMAAAGTNANGAANWAKPKAQHKLIVRWLRQTRCHVIFCLRAEERVRLEKDDKGKTVVVPIGWWPISEKRFMYDMTASFLLTPDAPGIPKPIKLQEQHRQFFPCGHPITRDSGRALAEWAAGGAAPVATQRDTYVEATEAATRGMAALQTFWNGLSRAERIVIKDSMDGLKVAATEADAAADENPFADPAITRADPNLDDPFGGKKIELVENPEGHREAQFEVVDLDGEVFRFHEAARACEAMRVILVAAARQSVERLDGAWDDNAGMVEVLAAYGFGAEAVELSQEHYRLRGDASKVQVEHKTAGGAGAAAPQKASRPASSPGPTTGHPGADAKLPAVPAKAPVEDTASRRGDDLKPTAEAQRGPLASETAGPSTGGTPEADLLGAAPDSLTVPLPPRPTTAQLDYFARQMLALIGEAPLTAQRQALIKQKNERGLGLLKAGGFVEYDSVMEALAQRPERAT